MKAMRIMMERGHDDSDNLLEIDKIELSGKGFLSLDEVYDWVKANPGDVCVNITPFPDLVPVKNKEGKKYVKSQSAKGEKDSLLDLPRQ